MHEFCFYMTWGGWSPEVWAAWIQVVGSFAALFLAIYVPVRMRRIEELDRIEAAISFIVELDRLSQLYVDTLKEPAMPLSNEPPSDFRSFAAGCETQAQNPATLAALVPILDRAKNAGLHVYNHWHAVASGSPRRDNPHAQAAARARRDAIATELAAARVVLEAWRRRHRLSLLWA